MVTTPRKKLDQYFTPQWLTNGMLETIESMGITLKGNILEPCCGDWSIIKPLSDRLDRNEVDYHIMTNDIDSSMTAQYHLDMRLEDSWDTIDQAFPIDWVITNPPYKNAIEIIDFAESYPRQGLIALMRLSYVEPCGDRVDFLEEFPPTNMIVTPRVSFTGKGTDKVTTAWLIWDKSKDDRPIQVMRRPE